MTLVKRTSDNGELATALANFYGAAEEMGLSEGLTNLLAHSERKTCVSVPVEMDDGTIKVFEGFRVAHNSAVGPSKGGVRFAPDVCLDECEALAFMMTWKCSLAGIPYGGGKGGIRVDPFSLSKKEKERMCRTYAARIEPVVGAMTDVPAPDMNTSGQEMVWFMDTISRMRGHLEPAIFTGKPIPLWGSKGRNAATGLGVGTCAIELMKALGKDIAGMRCAVMGFGNVGSFTAKTVHDAGAKVVAISDINATYYNPEGIDIVAAFKQTASHPKKWLDGFEKNSKCEKLGVGDVISVDCDIFLPCAAGGVLTDKTAGSVKAKYVVEGANNPTTPAGDKIMNDKGIIIVPDFLANSGGVIGSYFEWCQDLNGFFWTEKDYNERLLHIMRGNFEICWNYHKEHNVTMRRAAFLAAIKRVADATEMRGVYL